MEPYRTRLAAVTSARGNLCVGIDPHPHLLDTWGAPASVAGLERVARGMVAALGERVAVFKPQSAFFECYGSAGVAVLERVLADIAAAGALSILDAKRGDIGSTIEAYAAAYLADGSPVAADAITLSPYLGVGALAPAIDAAHATGRGVYLLCRTSNREGAEVQAAARDGRTVAQHVVDAARAQNARTGTGAVGLVIGATNASLDVDLAGFRGSVLVPGIGAQGGTMADLDRLFGPGSDLPLPSVSREVMRAGPDPAALRAKVDGLLGVAA